MSSRRPQDEGRNQERGPLGSGFSEKPKGQGWHRTLHNPHRDNHISWDVDENGDYLDGTGHEDWDNHLGRSWGPGPKGGG